MSTNTATMNGMSATEATAMSTETSIGTGETVGRTLKKAREEKNLSLDEVSRATKIRKEFLIAIEEDRMDALPGDVFARGFIRSYGDFLGVDGQNAALRAVRSPERDGLVTPGNIDKAAAGRNWALIVTALGGVAAAVAYYVANGGF